MSPVTTKQKWILGGFLAAFAVGSWSGYSQTHTEIQYIPQPHTVYITEPAKPAVTHTVTNTVFPESCLQANQYAKQMAGEALRIDNAGSAQEDIIQQIHDLIDTGHATNTVALNKLQEAQDLLLNQTAGALSDMISTQQLFKQYSLECKADLR